MTQDGPGLDGSATHMIMYNDGNSSFAVINDMFQDIATAITYQIRQTSDPAFPNPHVVQQPNSSDIIKTMNAPVLGTVLESNTCVKVRRGWLAYPAALIVLTTAFLVLTIVDTSLHTPGQQVMIGYPKGTSRLRPAGVWKSSILLYMFHGLEDRSLRTTEPICLVPMEEMERAANTISARLE